MRSFEKKPLETFWQDGKWYAYKSKNNRSKQTRLLVSDEKIEEDTLPLPLQQTITNDSLYKKYAEKHLNSINAATDGLSNIISHKAGYKRSLTGIFIANLLFAIGILASILTITRLIVNDGGILENIDNNTYDATKSVKSQAQINLGFNSAGLLITSLSLFAAFISYCVGFSQKKAEDKEESEKQIYADYEIILNRMPAIRNEIILKQTVVNKLMKLMETTADKPSSFPFFRENNDSKPPSLPQNHVFGTFDDWVTLLDEKDDLNIYDEICRSLFHTPYSEKNNNLIFQTINCYILGSLAMNVKRNSEDNDLPAISVLQARQPIKPFINSLLGQESSQVFDLKKNPHKIYKHIMAILSNHDNFELAKSLMALLNNLGIPLNSLGIVKEYANFIMIHENYPVSLIKDNIINLFNSEKNKELFLNFLKQELPGKIINLDSNNNLITIGNNSNMSNENNELQNFIRNYISIKNNGSTQASAVDHVKHIFDSLLVFISTDEFEMQNELGPSAILGVSK
jgi:hypothetical protein